MDLVTITDHDSIDGCLEFLSAHPDAPDFIIGEEVSCRLPGRRPRGAPRRLRHDRGAAPRAAAAAAERLRRHRVPARGRRVLRAQPPAVLLPRTGAARRAICGCSTRCRRIEVRNGTMLPAHNELVERDCRAVAGRRRSARRSRCSAAATRTRCGASARRGPRRPARRARRSSTACAQGRASPGGATAAPLRWPATRTASIGSYVASLAGFGPRDHAAWHRALCLAFSLVSLPFQFLPLAIVWRSKRARGTNRSRTASAAAADVARASASGQRIRLAPAHEPPSRRHHRHRHRQRARRDARGDLGRHAGRRRAACGRSRCSTPKAIAAGSPPKSRSPTSTRG